jgi:hypothetical protein
MYAKAEAQASALMGVERRVGRSHGHGFLHLGEGDFSTKLVIVGKSMSIMGEKLMRRGAADAIVRVDYGRVTPAPGLGNAVEGYANLW